MRLSLVIPAYNETDSIGRTVSHVCGYLGQQSYDWEVIVVIDDRQPSSAADEARAAAAQHQNVRVLENGVNRGKGYSVRRGFMEAQGDRKVFIDADLSLPIEGLEAMMARFDAGADVVIASRTAPGSRVEGAPPAMRDLMSKVFNLAVQAIALPGISDTQCGFKGFTATAAATIFSAAESDRFGFDVEALYLARKHGFRIDELPVICRYHGGSSVNRVSDGVRMFADVFALRLRHRK
jgi:dolichyl-phosphate beta-glucosyltransferase